MEPQGGGKRLQISYKALLYKIKQYNLTPPQKRRSLVRAQ
jgi:hypothetical protein